MRRPALDSHNPSDSTQYAHSDGNPSSAYNCRCRAPPSAPANLRSPDCSCRRLPKAPPRAGRPSIPPDDIDPSFLLSNMDFWGLRNRVQSHFRDGNVLRLVRRIQRSATLNSVRQRSYFSNSSPLAAPDPLQLRQEKTTGLQRRNIKYRGRLSGDRNDIPRRSPRRTQSAGYVLSYAHRAATTRPVAKTLPSAGSGSTSRTAAPRRCIAVRTSAGIFDVQLPTVE